MDSKLPEKIDLASIQPFVDALDLRRQLIHQLEKDLPNIVLEVSLESDFFFGAISTILESYIHKLIDLQPNSIPQLLYAIDVSEVKTRSVLAKEHVDSAKLIAQIVLEKEVQKVFIRNVYSGRIQL